MRIFSVLVPLLFGILLVLGSTYKLIESTYDRSNNETLYFEVVSDVHHPQSFAHELNIQVPGIEVIDFKSTYPISTTCDRESVFNKDRICAVVYEEMGSEERALLQGSISVPLSEKEAVFNNAVIEAYYYTDASFTNKLPQQIRILPKWDQESLSLRSDNIPEVLGLSDLGISDNIFITDTNLPLWLSVIVGIGFLLAAIAVIFNRSPRPRQQVSVKKVGLSKVVGQLFSLLFLSVMVVVSGWYISNTTQAPTGVDAAILWKEPIEYFEVHLDYTPTTNDLSLNKVLTRSGYFPKLLEVEDSLLKLELRAKDGSVLYKSKVVLPELRVPPDEFNQGGTASDISLSRDVITFVPQFKGQSILVIIFNNEEIANYDVSSYKLSESSRENALRSLAFAPGPEAPSDGYFDLVFIGDDYNLLQMGRFRSDVRSVENMLTSLNPYRTRSTQVRITLIENTDDLGCYRPPAVPRCVICNSAAVLQKVNQAAVPFDKVGVIYNDGQYGGCADYFGPIFQLANGPEMEMVGVHELGHTLGADDEYTYGGTGQLSNPQTCTLSNPDPAWQGIVAEGDYNPECSYTNYYRSSLDSIMRSLTVNYFNAVTNKLFNQQMDQLAGTFTTNDPRIISRITSPQSGDQITQNIDINVAHDNDANIQRAELWVNGVLTKTKYENLNSFFLASIPDAPTTIMVKAYDGAERAGVESTIVLNSGPTATPTPTQPPVTATPAEPTPTTINPTATPSFRTPTPTPSFRTPTPTTSFRTPTPTPSLRTPTPIPPTPTIAPGNPDLVPAAVERSSLYPNQSYMVRICNNGSNDNMIGAMVYELRNLDNSQTRTYSSVLPGYGACLDLHSALCAHMGVSCNTAVRLQVKIDPYNYIHETNETNNVGSFVLYGQGGSEPTGFITATPTPLPGEMPDLLPSDIAYDEQSAMVTASICNRGGSYEGNLEYFYYNMRDDLVYEDIGTINLDKDACSELKPVSCNRLSKNCQGSIDLEMVLDPKNEITEVDELNNRNLLSFTPPQIIFTLTPTPRSPSVTQGVSISLIPTVAPGSSSNAPSWGSILITFGIVLSLSSALFIVLKYRKELFQLTGLDKE